MLAPFKAAINAGKLWVFMPVRAIRRLMMKSKVKITLESSCPAELSKSFESPKLARNAASYPTDIGIISTPHGQD